jgi:CubicO group peptidase (beta-lactamase class C family)
MRYQFLAAAFALSFSLASTPGLRGAEAGPANGGSPALADGGAKRLVAAARAGDIDAIKSILAQGGDLNARVPIGLTALMTARLSGQKGVYDFLIQQGADASLPIPAPERLTDAFLASRFDAKSPGAAVLVARDGKILFEKGYGLADVEHQVLITPETKFRIGSITKQFTASAILRLQEAGRLRVTDQLARYYPDFPRGNEVTLRHLLTHTSGIHSYTEQPNIATIVLQPTSPAALIASIEKFSYDFNPGAKWSYSNSGYVILGDIVTQVSGENYADYLQRTFFRPLGMTGTGVYRNDAPPAGGAIGYSYQAGAFTKAPNWDMTWAGGAGALYSTVEDLFRWNEGIFRHHVLQADSLAAALTPEAVADNPEAKLENGYGYGWEIAKFRGAREISHNGGLPGFLAGLIRLPDLNFTVVVLTNALPPKVGDPIQLAQEITDCYLGADLAPRPALVPNPAVSQDALAAIVGRYLLGPTILAVTTEGGRAFAQLTGQGPHEIFPKSETEFFLKVVDAQLVFVKDVTGKVTGATLHQNGQTLPLTRLPDVAEVKLDDSQTDPLLGEYAFAPNRNLAISRSAGRLYAQLTGQPKLELSATSSTEFFLRMVQARLTFVEDADGKVISVILHQNGHDRDSPKVK